MIFSKRDIDLLRLVCWCQFILPADLARVCSDTELCNLLQMGLIKRNKKSGALVLSADGAALLKRIFDGRLPNLALTYRENIVHRRLRLSKLTLTAYKAGVQVFTLNMDELTDTPTLFLPAVTRGRGHNPWGSSRVAAVMHMGDLVAAAHYVCPGIGKLLPLDELNTFSNNATFLKTSRRGLIFAGESYGEILRELEQTEEDTGERRVSYGEAYRKLSLPVYLLCCNETGVKQLRIMSMPDYRTRLTKAALKAQYRPPPKDIPQWDGIYQNAPFVMAADMDLRRVDAAIEAAKAHGCGPVALAALDEQAGEVFFPRYRDTGLARVFTLTDAALAELLGTQNTWGAAARQPFLTAEGDVVDAPLIKADRKTGGQTAKPTREMDRTV